MKIIYKNWSCIVPIFFVKKFLHLCVAAQLRWLVLWSVWDVLIHLVDRWRLCRPGVTYHDPLGLLVKVLNFDINATVPLIYTIFSAIYYSVFTFTARSVQREPPRTSAWSGGDFNLAGSHAWRAEVPPHLEPWSGGDFNFTGIAACKVEVPLTSSTSLGGFTLGWPSCMTVNIEEKAKKCKHLKSEKKASSNIA